MRLRKLWDQAVSEGPPVIAAALLAEVFVPRLHSPLRELPYFFGLWAVCAAIWNFGLGYVRAMIADRRREDVS